MKSGTGDFSAIFQDTLGKPLDFSVFLSEHSHFKIGGAADYFFCARSVGDLKRAIKIARELSVYYTVMGGGYNLLFDDEGFRGLVIKNQVKKIERCDSGLIRCASGSSLEEVLEWCVEKQLGGLEFMAGIPGTVGGAICGNAGAFDEAIGDRVVEAVLFDETNRDARKNRGYFSFDYRYSTLKDRPDIVLEVVLKVEEKLRSSIEANMADILERRRERHPPWDMACAGSYFQNPILPDGKKVAAAKLLDHVGAKALREGDAAVYEGHANFIINRGNASAADVLRLASELKKRVKDVYGVDLKEEVIHVPAVPPAR